MLLTILTWYGGMLVAAGMDRKGCNIHLFFNGIFMVFLGPVGFAFNLCLACAIIDYNKVLNQWLEDEDKRKQLRGSYEQV